MKKIIFSILALLLIAGSGSCQEKIDTEKEKESIKALIEEELAAYVDRDFSRVEATWVHESTSRDYNMTSTGVVKRIGWSVIAKSDKEHIEDEDLWDDTENYNGEHSNFDIVVYGNTALAFHQTKFFGKYLGEEFTRGQERIVHLVKVEGEWKIDFLGMYTLPPEEVEEAEEDPDVED